MDHILGQYRTGTYSRPDYGKPEMMLTELMSFIWVLAIVCGAWFAPFPANILLWVWVIGMVVCIPMTASINAHRDSNTTVCREMMYFLRRGIVVMRIIGWPFTFLSAYYWGSQRSAYISQLCSDFRDKHYLIRSDTAWEMAASHATKIDENCDAVQKTADQVLATAAAIPAAACRTGVVAVTLTGIASTPVYAQDSAARTTSIVIARAGENLQAPYTGTYHLLEALQVRGKWIYPDIGYVDFATGNYRELFIGGGQTLYDSKRATLTGEMYFVQATGPAAKRARYLWPNLIADFRLTPKLTNQTSYFPYVPLNKSAHIQQVIERSKLEYGVTTSVKVGAGYGAYQYGNGKWQSKPFITTTFATKAGSFEFWLQKMPAGAQVQMRYAKVFK